MALYGVDGKALKLPKSFYERPLTPKEAEFAAENIGIVDWYLIQRGLDKSEWYDIVVFRYLMAVKRWLALPELQEQTTFITTACSSMRSAISHEFRRQGNEPKTISLYEPLKNMENKYLIDTIAAYDMFTEE